MLDHLRLALASLCCTAVVVVACSGEPAASPPRPSPTAETATPAATHTPAPTSTPAPTPVPTPPPAGGVDLIGEAVEHLLDFYIEPPQQAPLLNVAWRAALAEAGRAGVDTRGLTFSPAGDRTAAWQGFRGAYAALAERMSEEQAPGVRFAAIDAMAETFDDCHTFFLPPARTEVLDELRTGRGSVGVGIEVAPVLPPYVREAVAGGPARRAGILAGDALISIDGADITRAPVEEIDARLRGEPGSVVNVAVRKPASGVVESFDLTRSLVRPPVAEGRALEGGLGYIRVRAFTTGPRLLEELDAIVAGFEAGGVRGWIVDLRDNPGGDSDLTLSGRFVGPEVVERTLLRGGDLEIKHGEGEPYAERPIAVLTNAGTASVAEIFAATLQDYGRARVFGAVSARCAGFVSLQELNDGSTVGVTIARSLTPRTEQPLWRTGVVPNEAVRQTSADISAGNDPILDRAAAWLATQMP